MLRRARTGYGLNAARPVPITGADIVMPDHLLTLRDLTGLRTPLGHYELRVIERSLRERLRDLEARVDAVLAHPGPPSFEQVGAVDVLCAAIAELREMLDETRREGRRDDPRRGA